MRIKDSVVLVTGADGGLGSALVGELVERGAKRIYAGGLRAERLESVVALAPTKITALTLDITDDDVAATAGAAAYKPADQCGRSDGVWRPPDGATTALSGT